MSTNRSDRTMEIEAIDIVDDGSAPASASTYPVVFDAHSSKVPAVEDTDALAEGRRRNQLRRVVIGCVSACGILLVFAAFRAPAHAVASAATRPTAPPPAPVVETPTQDSTPWTEVPTHAAAQSASGAIEVAEGRVVAVDGRRMTGRAAVLPCGRHQLRVGRGAPRAVVVPCGGTLSVEPNGSISVY